MSVEDFELNAKQQKFAEEYILNGDNGKQAAIKAGYAERSAEMTASRLIRNIKVSAYIRFLRQKATTKTIATKEEVLQRLTELAMMSRADLKSFNAPKEVVAKLSDQLKACELLAKHHGALDAGPKDSGDDSGNRESRMDRIRRTLGKKRK